MRSKYTTYVVRILVSTAVHNQEDCEHFDIDLFKFYSNDKKNNMHNFILVA
jgi:hypothetical protein